MSRGTKPTILQRRRRVEELLNAGLESSVKIAEALAAEGITVTDRTVREDIAAVGLEWQESIVRLRHVRQMRKVRDAERRNAELQAEWERSKKDRERRRAKTRKKTGGQPLGGRNDRKAARDEQHTEAEQTTEGRIGDVALMTEQRRNDEFVARLLGLEQPQKVAPTDPSGDKEYGGAAALTDEQLASIIAGRGAREPS